MSNIINFKKTNSKLNVPRIGGESFLPDDIKWPINPNNEKLTLIFSLPTNFLNSVLQFNYPKDKVISVFTTYNKQDYFLDSIVYHGDEDELNNIKKGFTKVILHSIGISRNDSNFLIPAKEIIIDKEMVDSNCHYGSILGGTPVFAQNELLNINNYRFCMQIYGSDFPEEFEDIFYLNDSMGYLLLNREANPNDIGLFFTQCS